VENNPNNKILDEPVIEAEVDPAAMFPEEQDSAENGK
jgi:hypothetical protein